MLITQSGIDSLSQVSLIKIKGRSGKAETIHSRSFNLGVRDLALTKSMSELQVRKELSHISNKKAAGPDKIRSSVLKSCCAELAMPLTAVFNKAIETSSFPAVWKVAEIIPLRKNVASNELGNFRPVALTSILGKTLEKLLRQLILIDTETKFDK